MRRQREDEVTGRTCAVTGANGYVGSRLSAALDARGWTVYRLGRNHGSAPSADRLAVPFSLADGVPEGFFAREAIRALVHCAYDFRPTTSGEIHRTHVLGSVRLTESA